MAGTEALTEKVDGESYEEPPRRSTRENADEHRRRVDLPDILYAEPESGEQRDEHKYEGRVGESNQEYGYVVLPQAAASRPVAAYLDRGVLEEYVSAYARYGKASQDLYPQHVLPDEGHDQRKRKESDRGENSIGRSRPQAGEETGALVLTDGTLYAKHSYRPYRDRCQETNYYAAKKEFEPHITLLTGLGVCAFRLRFSLQK